MENGSALYQICESSDAACAVVGLIYALIIFGMYFLPAFIAWARKHRNGVAIFILTLLLGWTGLGWIVALVWACTSNVRSKEVAS